MKPVHIKSFHMKIYDVPGLQKRIMVRPVISQFIPKHNYWTMWTGFMSEWNLYEIRCVCHMLTMKCLSSFYLWLSAHIFCE